MEQVGKSDITYVKPNDINKKEGLKDITYSSKWSSTRTISYTLTKPYGQANENTAVFQSLRKSENAKPHLEVL